MKAFARNLKISPRKVRLVADSIRGMDVEKALMQLYLTEKHASGPLVKLIKSAIANGVSKGMASSNLKIDRLIVNEGVTIKRIRPGSRGHRSARSLRSTHVSIFLKGREN